MLPMKYCIIEARIGEPLLRFCSDLEKRVSGLLFVSYYFRIKRSSGSFFLRSRGLEKIEYLPILDLSTYLYIFCALPKRKKKERKRKKKSKKSSPLESRLKLGT